MGASSTHVAISSDRLVRTGQFLRIPDMKLQATLDGVAHENPVRLAK
jgi:hypothetical protein